MEVNVDDKAKISMVMMDDKWFFVTVSLEVLILICTKHASAVSMPFSNTNLS